MRQFTQNTHTLLKKVTPRQRSKTLSTVSEVAHAKDVSSSQPKVTPVLKHGDSLEDFSDLEMSYEMERVSREVEEEEDHESGSLEAVSKVEKKYTKRSEFRRLVKLVVKKELKLKLRTLNRIPSCFILDQELSLERWPVPSVPTGFKPYMHTHVDLTTVRSKVITLGFEVKSENEGKLEILDNPKPLKSNYFLPNFEILDSMNFRNQDLYCEAVKSSWETMWNMTPTIKVPLSSRLSREVENWRLPMIYKNQGSDVTLREMALAVAESHNMENAESVLVKIVPNMDPLSDMSYIFEYP